MRIRLICILLALSMTAWGQVGLAAPVVVNGRTGQPLAGVEIAVCAENPGTTLNPPCGEGGNFLLQTFTSTALTTGCTLNAASPGPLNGTGCTNPGLADISGNMLTYLLFSQLAWYEVYGGGITPYAAPMNTIVPFTPGFFSSGTNNEFNPFSIGAQPVGSLLSSFNASGLATCCLTDALSGSDYVPSSAAGTQADAGGFYIINNASRLGASLGGGAVGVYAVAVCAASSSHCWGMNPVVSDSSSLAGIINYGIEDDVAIYNTGTIGAGLLFNGNFHVQPTNYPAIAIVKAGASGFSWTDGLRINAGATSNFIALNIGAQSASAFNVPSQIINMTGVDSGGTQHTGYVGASAKGDVVLSPASSEGVVVNGALDQFVAGNFANVCTMASSTTCTVAFTQSWTGPPICIASPQNSTAAATTAYCVVSGGGATITAAASNSGTWAAVVIGNPH